MPIGCGAWKVSVLGIAGMALLFATAANSAEPPLGSVMVAQNANIDRTLASLGTNIYSGDRLNTTIGGMLRLRIGQSQLYMLAMSEMKLVQDGPRVDAQLYSGTAGLAATAKDAVEIETAVGMIRPADDSRAFGQATVVGVNRVNITCFEGTLLLTRNGASRTIEAGKSYTVSVPLAQDPPQAGPSAPPSNNKGSGSGDGWIFSAVVTGGAALAGFALWEVFSESQSTPNNQ